MKLFKYKGIEFNNKSYSKSFLRDINCLLNNKIWFSKIEYLNDPFEGGYRNDFIKNKNIKLLKSEDNYNKIIKSREKILKIFKENSGILSLTTENKNLLMWSHYTNNHSGYCLEFDIDCNNFIDNNFNKIQLRKVNYNSKPYLDDILNIDFYKNITFKSKHWKYENEYRFISQLFGEQTYNDNCLKSIFIGANCCLENELLLYMVAYFKKTKIFKSRFYNGSYDLYFQELDINNISKNINFNNLLSNFKFLLNAKS